VLGQAERPQPSWRLSSALKPRWQGCGKGPVSANGENDKAPTMQGEPTPISPPPSLTYSGKLFCTHFPAQKIRAD
jgi:hypothetical protein